MSQQTTTSRTGDRTELDRPKRLIASNRVEGTAVYDRRGEKLGRIEYFMVDKVAGQADYAVLSFGGLFGLGDHHHPLPWNDKTAYSAWPLRLSTMKYSILPSFSPSRL